MKNRPIILEIAYIILRTRGGILGVYLTLYLIYTGLSKVCEALYKLVKRVHLKLNQEEKELIADQSIEEKSVIGSGGGWYQSNKGKYHWFDQGRSICGKYHAEVELISGKDPSENMRCKICQRILSKRT